MKYRISSKFIVLALCCLWLASAAPALGKDQGFADVQINTIKVANGIHMLMGKGGNIGVSSGSDGVFLIDDQFAPLTEKIKAAVTKINPGPIRFVLNTHWHFDHVGGNENFGELGAIIVAHENVRKRLSSDQMVEFFQKKVPATPKTGLPVVTFTRDLTFHLNDETIEVFHVQNAHTDGDAVVFFRKANVVHTGDIYFSGIYPFIDTGANGSVDGVINAANIILEMIDDNTKIIPGHGPLSTKAEFRAYVNMLVTLRGAVGSGIAAGKSLEEIQKSKPSKDFDAKWGGGFLSPDKFIQLLYIDLNRNS